MQTTAPPADSHWRTEYPFESQWLQTAHGRVHYVQQGQGRPLVMVHGNPTWSFLWRHLIQGLQDTNRCVALDHLGCGLSDKPTDRPYNMKLHVENLVQLLDELDLQDATLLAHDWGGPIGLGAVQARPDRFSRIVLFNTGAFPPPFIPWRIRACRWPVVGQLGVQGLNLFALAAQTMAVHRPHTISPQARAGLLAPYDNWAHRHAIYQFVRDIPSSPKHPTWADLQQVEAGLDSLKHLPIKLIWGMRDWCFRPSCLEQLKQHWPAADATEIHDAGHWVTEEAQGEVLAQVRDFLGRTD